MASPTGSLQHDIQLARPYTGNVDIGDYFISEKLDGIRARWTGHKLLTRNGNTIHAPRWFTQGWPDTVMDGELWTARGQFEEIASVVLSETPDNRWRDVKLMLFDLPALDKPFYQRVKAMEMLVAHTDNPYLSVIRQFTLSNNQALQSELDTITRAGGEGLMLHHKNARYTNGRSASLLKAKRYEDDEARVIAHIPGRGQFAGMLGAILVETRQGVRFKIGSGFSEAQRRQPPAIGSWITFKHYGFTSGGIPRFASFMHIRPNPPVYQ